MRLTIKKRAALIALLCITPTITFSQDKLKVVITGIEDKQALKNAKNAAYIYSYNKKEAPDPLRLQWLFNEANQEITTALMPFGYYNATVESTLKKGDSEWVAYYKVSTGKQLQVDHLTLDIKGDGKKNRSLKRIVKKSKLKQGENLDHESYEVTKNDLLEKAIERGYFDANFEKNEILIDLDRYTSEINLVLNTGTRYKFGDVTFHDDYFDHKFLQRFVQFNNTVNYSDNRILTLQSDLSSSEYFNEILVSPTIDKENKEVPLDVFLKQQKPRIFTAGLGYSTDIGYKVLGSVNWRYLNKYGHKLATEMLWGQKKRDGIIKYTIPGKNPILDSYSIYTRYLFEDTKNKDYTTLTLGGSIDRKRHFYSYGLALDYQYDKFRDRSGEEHRTNIIIPSLYVEWKSRENVRFGRSGFKVSGKIRGASSSLGSDISFIQTLIKAHYYMPFGKNDRLILRGQLGHTSIDKSDLNRLPPSLRFYAGGDNSVRGYKLDGIGELGYRDDIVGGKKLIVASAEWEHQFIPNWAGAVFIDAGDAFNGNRPNMKVGAGVGVRWYSPIGSVRFDVAHGFNKQGDTYRLHLTIGADL